MQKKLTARTIETLPPAVGKRYEVRDQTLSGFHVRVSSNGKKVFYISLRINGRMSRKKLGTYPALSLADARECARKVQRDVELGRFDESEPVQTLTLGEVVPQFIELYAKPRNRDWKGAASVLQKFKPLFDRPIDQIKRADIVRMLDAMAAGGAPTRANRALAAIRKLMAWCVDRGMIEHNIVTGMKAPTKEVPRDRVLSDVEVSLIWQAAEQEGFPFGPFLKLLILTGQRRGEVSGMRWSEVDFEQALWILPAERTKNATSHTVPLAPLAISILEALPRFEGSDLVFTLTGRTPISGFGRLKRRLDSVVGIDATDWRLHDIRRTVATNMALLRVQPHIIEAVLNHKTGIVSGVAAVYNRHAYLDEKREALEGWAHDWFKPGQQSQK